ncbi:polyprenol reductase [Oncorhynchus tshawytscha]|uniref:polyprenol reductase n=1 Tax=Oncorhynchus tshawytscha TaxID=74940 RepID=UPI001C3D7D61|nr:polyprenol reductase [Oncorhynchus tshawytscha]
MLTLLGFCVIDFLWLSLALCFLLAFCVHRLSRYLPTGCEHSKLYILFQDLIRYGKTKGPLKRDHWLRVFDIPKRWFWHFYAISVGWNGFLIVLSLNMIVWGQKFPSWLTDILRFLTTGGPVAVRQVPQVSAVLVQVLLWVHSLRRLLECHLVSVFSDGVIHIVQYIFGLAYYILLGLTVLCSDSLIIEGGELCIVLLHNSHTA